MEGIKVVQLVGHHYHNPKDPDAFAEDGGEAYLRKTLLRNLKCTKLELPPTLEEQQDGLSSTQVSMSELGISHPVLLYVPNVVEETIINPDLLPGGELPPHVVIEADYQAQLSGQSGGGMTGGGSGMSSGRGSSLGSSGRGGAAGQTQQTVSLRQYARQRGVGEPLLTVRRFDFVIQFAWAETPPSQRKLNKEQSAESDMMEQ